MRSAAILRIENGWKVSCRDSSGWVSDLFVYDDDFFSSQFDGDFGFSFSSFSVALSCYDLWVEHGIQQPVLI